MEIHELGLRAISDKIRRRDLSSQEVTRSLLGRIDRYEPRLHSIAYPLPDSALAEARKADAELAAGLWRGPLHGVPIGIKDLLWTAGIPTAAGMEVLRDFRPQQDATVVRRLRNAGAVLIAKLAMTEGAVLEHHPSVPTPINPWSALHWAGASSSGSGVAVAAGFCFGAIGSDTAGSIRIPSAANNLTGLKPTFGRVSRFGVIPLNENLDHIGPMARSAADAAAILHSIAGADAADPTTLLAPVPHYLAECHGSVSGLRLGIDWTYATEGADTEIVEALHRAIEAFQDLGMRLREVVFPPIEEGVRTADPTFLAEIAVSHRAHFPAQADRYGPWLRRTLEAAGRLDPLDVAFGLAGRERFRGRIAAMFKDVDLLITPAMPGTLPTCEAIEAVGRGEARADPGLGRYTIPFNVSRNPTLSLPAGFTRGGLPIGIQLVAPHLAEALLIRAGNAFQAITAHHTALAPLD